MKINSPNKDLNEREILLWNRVQSAYKNLDLESLKNIEILLKSNEAISNKSSFEELEEQKEKLWKKIEKLNKNIQELNERFPINLKEKLNDFEWVSREVDSYQNKTEEIDSILPNYKKIYNELLIELYGKIEEHPENL